LVEEHKTFLNLQKYLRVEEEHWCLKSQSIWLQVGENNTKFFHRQAKARVWRNKGKEIINEVGETVTYFEKIKTTTLRHFEKLYKVERSDEIDLVETLLENIPTLIRAKDN